MKLKYAKPVKVNKKALGKKADTIFSLFIRRIGVCELAGKDGIRCGGSIQCAHIETRGVRAMRWNPMNALCICGGHHWYYTNNESKWQEVIKKEFPKKYAFYLKHKNDKWDGDYEKVFQKLHELV
jgi:hypothetical protein